MSDARKVDSPPAVESRECGVVWRGMPLLAALLQLCANPVSAEVTSVGAAGFEVREHVHVAAQAPAVYAAMVTPGRWWDSRHTYSGDSSRLTLDVKAGGCWCEALADGGSVQHLTLTYIAPGKTLRFVGSLGPLQPMGVVGSMTINATNAGDGADLTLTYAVGGYSKDGFENLSKAVDSVLNTQVARLKKLVETGAAEAIAP